MNINRAATYVILFFLMASGSLLAQRVKWEETFNDKDILSRGWKLVNNDGGSTDIELYEPFEFFQLGQQGSQTGTYFFKLGFESVNRFNQIDDWIILPRLFDIHEGDSLSFWCGAIDRQFKDSLKVWISTTNDSISSFTQIDYFKVNGPVGSWHKKSYDVSQYAGKNIYVAVNYYIKDAGAFGNSSDGVWIDHFTLSGKGFGSVQPVSYQLYQNFPNPFNPQTDISFSIAADTKVTIDVFNSIGQLVSQPVNGNYPTGTYTINFDGTNLSSGVYFYRITAGSFVEEKKMVLVK